MQTKSADHTLETYPAWVVFRLDPRLNKRPAKIPIDPVSGRFLKDWQKPTQWLTHTEATRLCKQGLGDGISFVFSKHDPFTLIDLDECFDQQGNLLPYAREIVDALDSYTELSVTGTGLHIVVFGRKNIAACKLTLQGGDEIEVYDRNRAMAYTHKTFDGHNVIQYRQNELDAVLLSCTSSAKQTVPRSSSPKSSREDRSCAAYKLVAKLRAKGLSERRILAQLRKSPWWDHYTSDQHARADIRRIIAKIKHPAPRNPNRQAEWNPQSIALSSGLAAVRTSFSKQFYDISAPHYDPLLSLYEHLIRNGESAAVAVPCGKGKTTAMKVATAAYASPTRRFLLVQSTVHEIKQVAEQLRALGCNAVEWHSYNEALCTQAPNYQMFLRSGGKRLCATCQGCTAHHREAGKDRFDDKQYDVLVCSKEHYRLAFFADKLGEFNFVFHDEEPDLFSYFNLDWARLQQLQRIFANNQHLSDAFQVEYETLRDTFCQLARCTDEAGDVKWHATGGGQADRITNPFAKTLTHQSLVLKSLWNRFNTGIINDRDLADTLEFFRFFAGDDIWCMATAARNVSPHGITLHFMRGRSVVTTKTPTAILNASTRCSPILWDGFTVYSIPAIQPSYSKTTIISRLEQPTQSAMASPRHKAYDDMVLSHCLNQPVGWIENANLQMKRIGKPVLALKTRLKVTAELSVGVARGSNALKDCDNIVMNASLFSQMPIYVLTAAIVTQSRIEPHRIWKTGHTFQNARFTQQGFSDSEIQSVFCAKVADTIYQLAMRGVIRSKEAAPYSFFTRIPNVDVAFLIRTLMPGCTIKHDLSDIEEAFLAGQAIADIARSASSVAHIRSDKNRQRQVAKWLQAFTGAVTQPASSKKYPVV
jgi:hypothetical protein